MNKGQRRSRGRGAAITLCLTLMASLAAVVAAPTAGATTCTDGSTGLVPLIDLGGEYQGRSGFLYPEGNVATGDHLARGISTAAEIGPLDAEGNPDPEGSFVFIGIGGSIVSNEFGPFIDRVSGGVNSDLVMVNAGIGGQDLRNWVDPASGVWDTTQNRLDTKGVTAEQVQVVWIKNVWARNLEMDFESWVATNLADTRTLVEVVTLRFPNVVQIYLSSRSYGGYVHNLDATVEPYSYEHGFAVKDFVAEHLDRTEGPWIGWGPYLWTDGEAGRSDGLTSLCEDVTDSGSHLSDLGKAKMATLLDDFFSSSATSDWFRSGGVESGQPVITSLDPSSLAPGATAQIVVTGSSLPGEPILSLGSGVTVNEAVTNDPNTLTAQVTVAAEAELGPRDVVVTDSTGEKTAICAACFAVTEESTLSVASATPSAIEAGGTVEVTLSGTGFEPGATVQVTPARRVSVISVQFQSTTSLAVVLSARGAAPLGMRNLVVTTPDGQTTSCACVTVVDPDPDPDPDPDVPTVTSATPDRIERAKTTQVVLTGTGFTPGTTVTVSPARRVQITAQSVISESEIVLTLNVRAAAPLGMRNLVVTTPEGPSVTCACVTVVEAI